MNFEPQKEGNPILGYLIFLLVVPVLLAAMAYWLLWDLKEFVREAWRRLRCHSSQSESPSAPTPTVAPRFRLPPHS